MESQRGPEADAPAGETLRLRSGQAPALRQQQVSICIERAEC